MNLLFRSRNYFKSFQCKTGYGWQKAVDFNVILVFKTSQKNSHHYRRPSNATLISPNNNVQVQPLENLLNNFFFASCQIGYFEFYLRKQSLGGILYKMCSKKFRKIYRKTPVPESLFNKVAALSLQLYQKGNSGADVFLWVLRNSKEHLFLQTLSPPAAPVAASLSL